MKQLGKQTMLAVAATMAMAVSGCAGTAETTPQPVAAVSVPQYKTVSFADVPTNPKIEKVSDKSDVKKIVTLGLALSGEGKHKEAADVFEQALKDFKSKDSRLEQSIVQALICEHFKAGMIDKVREDFVKLDSYRTSVYDKFDDNADIAKIRKLVSTKK